MNSLNLLIVSGAVLLGAIACTIIGCQHEEVDSMLRLRSQAVDRGCMITPNNGDFIFDCRKS